MSSTNYDVELPITYSETYKHYIPTYKIAVPYYWLRDNRSAHYIPWVRADYQALISFDTESEIDVHYTFYADEANPPITLPPDPFYNNQSIVPDDVRSIPASGIYSKIYFRNPHSEGATFSTSNCHVGVMYGSKATFEVQWNSVGFAANTNAWFKCSTVQKNTYAQYEWTSATVYYKESTDANYQSVVGTISGSWSDVTISTNLSLSDGVTYDIYITAVADDGSTATTPIGQFTTTDAAAVATCISPSGAFTSGDVTFVWSHSTAYGTPQYAYDLQYSTNNGGSWTTLKSHEVTQNTTFSTTLSDAGVYLWRVRTYNTNDVVGEWAEASFVNNMPATAPTNLVVNTKGRPTVGWASSSQSAYQVQFLLNDTVAYDSGAVYTSETSHFVNNYFDDNRAYTVRVRVYNALGEISGWTTTGYQQPSVNDVVFTVEEAEGGGAVITITPDAVFTKYYILRDNNPIAMITGTTYTDKYAVGLTNYGVVAVTSDDQSDIQTQGFRVSYPHATIIAQNGQAFLVNKRVNEAYQVETSNQADINKANFIGDSFPTHYPSAMRLKSFTINCFDDQGMAEDLLGQMVFYADNFENGGWCMVTTYSKTDNYVKNGQGVYANEVSLTLEVTNYDDSIEYAL